MPDFMVSPFDNMGVDPDRVSTSEPVLTEALALPVTGWEATMRGLRGRCPRCGDEKLFSRFLKPVPHCARCGQDWSHQQTDDFPAYVSIFLTGHLLAPVIIALAHDAQLSVPMLLAIIMPLSLTLMIGLLQPAKGGIMALQWWLGIHGFQRERPETTEADIEIPQ